MAGTTIHRSNRNLYASKKSNFLYWAERNPEEAWEQASSERNESPWKLQALRAREGRAAAAAIRAVHLDALRVAEAKVSTIPAGPGRKAAQAFSRMACKRYAEVEEALRPRPHRR